jgi:integration host factor beta subunit
VLQEIVMTKSELIEKVLQTHGMLNMKVSEMLVNTVFDSIEEALKSGDKVEIRGFGSFTIRERTGREARNPKSGEVVRIPSKKTPFFKTGKDLKERVNG